MCIRDSSYSIANIEKYQQRKNKTTLSEKAIPAIYYLLLLFIIIL